MVTAHEKHIARREALLLLCAGSLALLTACSPLEPIDPMAEPEVSDLRLTVDTLKSTVRDAQRTITDLRAELDARRQELAEAQIARAQLEGRLREAERRLMEARHVIDLQREELAGSRAERERTAKTGMALRNQLSQLQKQLAKLAPSRDVRPTGASAPRPSGAQRAVASVSSSVDPDLSLAAIPAVHQPTAVAALPSATDRVVVKPGDTLWSIAQRHRVPVKRLMQLNRLTNATIEVGQVLWLVERAHDQPGPNDPVQ